MPRAKNLTGQQFNFLFVIKDSGVRSTNRSIKWECMCVCGKQILVDTSLLTGLAQKSCGCKTNRNPKIKHGHSRKQLNSKTYNTWANMIQRCTNKNNAKYKNYGGRGITVCKDWFVFENFLKDMGEKPENMSIERIDVNKGYTKENCKWDTHKQQANNKTCNRILNFDGKSMTTSQWADHLGMKFATLRMRLHRNWPIERALNVNKRLKSG